MEKVKRHAIWVVLLSALLIAGCTGVTNESIDKSGLQISIQAPMSAKGISSSDYDVTSVDITVTDSGTSDLIAEMTWEREDGDTSYDVQVPGAGDYDVHLVHHGEQGEDTVSAAEQATITIAPGIITVVLVIPGQIGLITVDGVDAESALYGYTSETSDYTGGLSGGYGYVYGSPITLPEGTVTALGFVAVNSGENISLALYADSGGTPGNLVVNTGSTTTTAGLFEVPVTDTAITAGVYWVMFAGDSGYLYFRYSDGPSLATSYVDYLGSGSWATTSNSPYVSTDYYMHVFARVES